MEHPKNLKIENFTYSLPEERIAKFPLPTRDESKLLIYKNGTVSEKRFFNISDYIAKNELVIINDTKVIQARLNFKKATGAAIEVFCLEPFAPNDYLLSFQQTTSCSWLCLIGNLKKWHSGTLTSILKINNQEVALTAERKAQHGTSFEVEFSWDNSQISFSDILESFGELPIPPYLNRKTEESDKQSYQTVYSKVKGSVAAPTAGLHFTERVLNDLHTKSIDLKRVTLHVGAGTFRPVKSEFMGQHQMHAEYISVPLETIDALLQHRCQATAVGTTSVRTIESLYYLGVQVLNNATERCLHVEQWEPYESNTAISPEQALNALRSYMQTHQLQELHASTQIIITPGYEFHFVKKMITNFHQPQSTLLLLVSAFVKGNWQQIYDYALAHDFRFLSYGDSSLLIP